MNNLGHGSERTQLYGYAARSWGYYACAASTEVEELILSFLESEAKVPASNQAMLASESRSWGSGYSQRAPEQMIGVHFAAYFGLREALMALLKNEHVPDTKDNGGRTTLLWAVENGREAVVKLLVEKGAKTSKYVYILCLEMLPPDGSSMFRTHPRGTLQDLYYPFCVTL